MCARSSSSVTWSSGFSDPDESHAGLRRDTLLPHDELDALTPTARSLLSEPITKAAVYDLEQALEAQVKEKYLTAVIEDGLPVDRLLDDHFVRQLHRELYGEIWSWAGVYRLTEVNIGIAPERIAAELRSSLGTLLYRWQVARDWSPHQFGIAVHAETVRIHPFTDGNGRLTRLLADLVFLTAQEPERSELYDWEIDRAHYIELLRQYDGHRNPDEPAAFIRTQSLD